jgi:CRISPR-associated protein Cas5d
VLKEIAFTSFRRNEVDTRASSPSHATIQNGGFVEHYFADEVRAQRNTVALRDVDYVVSAEFFLTAKAGPGDNVPKFLDIFRRRVERGQHFHQPYFGCREFAADISPATGDEEAVPDTRDLGLMLWDIAFSSNENRPIFFHAKLNQGVLDVPANPERESVE